MRFVYICILISTFAIGLLIGGVFLTIIFFCDNFIWFLWRT